MVAPSERAYPADIAARVREAWPAMAFPLPSQLEAVLDTAYHASFLRDEERPVTCRILVIDPDELPKDAGPPTGLQPLAFREARSFDEHEVRRLSPAAKYHRAFIGVYQVGDQLVTWGLVQSGPRWLQAAHGGRASEPPMPPCLVVRVIRPGHLAVSCGNVLVVELRGGRLTDVTLDVFASRWLPAQFAEARLTLAEEHLAGNLAGTADTVSDLTKYVAQQMVKRVIATMRAAHHGGALLVLPSEGAARDFLTLKYSFRDEEPRRRFRNLMLSILTEMDDRAACSGGEATADLYANAAGRKLAELDEAMFELSHVIAALADVDGAVVLTKRFELLGFGAEIVGALPPLDTVHRALDLEADTFLTEAADSVGTRHRSAYRLCAAVPGAVAIVVSQDGSARFATAHRGHVTYWDHGAGDE